MAEANPMRPVTAPLRTMELIRERTVDAVLGQSAINHAGLIAEIRRRFGSTDVATGALVREPVIQGAAPFKVDGRTFADCAGSLLHRDVIQAIGSDKAGDYRFPPDAQPYRHQIHAWEHLTAADRRSVLVSSGTGSGKTECFLMPLLSDLANEAENGGRLSGVRALALYPLNALIASQEERLKAWTVPFGGKLRFGLYNGLTPEKLRDQDKPGPEQAGDRQTLRSDPPPILVTNVTMLEYMLVRRIDRPLIENSYGKLRWIILDEAHSYVGSSAAEIALLLRRALLTFGVTAENVRFVATSATIGGEGTDVTEELRRFLRDISGAPESQVRIVVGERQAVFLPSPAQISTLTNAQLSVRDAVAASAAVQAFVREAEFQPMSLARATALLRPTAQPLDHIIEAIADDSDKQRGPLLPLRIHGFLRAVPGLWSCINPVCNESPADWPFGAIAVERVDICPHCSSPVLEIMTCRECGEPYLDCEERDGRLQPRFTPPTIDEFAALREREIADEDDKGDIAETDDYETEHIVVAVRVRENCRTAHVIPTTGQRHDRAEEGTAPFRIHSPDQCSACGALSGRSGAMLRPFRYGAPFLIGNAAPVLLEGVEPRKLAEKGAFRPPADGRQLLSFTDSRQGTARFAANLQTNAERGYLRGFIYHAVQGSMESGDLGDPAIASLRQTIADLEAHAASSTALAETVSRLKKELSDKLTPNFGGIAWPELRQNLALQPEVMHWMTKVWGLRDDRYRDPAAFAEFLLLREFSRRPRRGNTLETMGLARLRYDAIDRAVTIPEPMRARGKTVADWRGLLYSMIDMTVRGQTAIRADWNDVHWLHSRRPTSTLLPPDERSEARREFTWPSVGAAKGLPSNLVLILEKALQLDRHEGRDRYELNEILEAAWEALKPIFSSSIQPGYALDFAKARVAPVVDAWKCPVTRRVLSETVLGYTQYGHRDGLKTASQPLQELSFPKLVEPFPRGINVENVRAWLMTDPKVRQLRDDGIWANLHDRTALFSPYIRAAEHSAQQPASRLRRFEREFKAGEINILNCSTTMEMGVDIGSVSAVMMTNVPPSLANYRQRVGRAGRRNQGFASSLTYTRDTPLDREAFREPEVYLGLQTRAPQVKLDSRRIVQRHVNALLLARWFAVEGGEAMKAHAGDFFGCPEGVGTVRPVHSPAATCGAWIRTPTTIDSLNRDVARLVQGTVLDGDRRLFDAAADALMEAEHSISREWQIMQDQAATAPVEARASVEYQLRRLARENLLKELAVRSILPGHGLPTAVVTFVHDDKPASDEKSDGEGDGSRRRRSYPSRTLDIAIRDYAPGADVVVDGLVYKSAGLTLNWQRPADDVEAREVQNIRVFWTCPSCGAADCAAIAPEHCPSCHEQVPFEAQRRFLAPAGFTVDMAEKPHADTDEVSYVEPEAEQIVARGAAWQACADPRQGRLRSSPDGLVFFSSRGRSHKGYHVCLECGRAEPVESEGDGKKPLKDHAPLRGTRRDKSGLCPGNEKSFKITAPIALGHETITDVAEIQPVGLENAGAAWALLSALREALARSLGIETGELGMAVRPARTPLGQRTHSLFLFDRASGGAGFAPQAVAQYESLLDDARKVLDCKQDGCITGCSACVLTADLFRQQGILDRKAAFAWAEASCQAFAEVPEADRAAPGALYSRSTADELVAAVEAGAREVTVWASKESDIAGIHEGLFAQAALRIADRGGQIHLVIDPAWLNALDPAAKLALRDGAKMYSLDLRKGMAPCFPNGAKLIAATTGMKALGWASREDAAGALGFGWGQGTTAPVVRFSAGKSPLSVAIDPNSLLPPSGTHLIEVSNQLDVALIEFGRRFADLVLPAIRAVGGSGLLTGMSYNDRYLQTPLSLRLLSDSLGALKDRLGSVASPLSMQVVTNPLRPNERQPFTPDHDWQWSEDRDQVLHGLLQAHGFEPTLIQNGALHGRVLTLTFVGEIEVRVILDQGFGPWRAPSRARFEFGADVSTQLRRLIDFNALIDARGSGYFVVTK